MLVVKATIEFAIKTGRFNRGKRKGQTHDKASPRGVGEGRSRGQEGKYAPMVSH